MAFERQWAVVPPQAFTANGTQFGVVTLASTAGFKVKQSAYLINMAGDKLAVQIKEVTSPTKLIVGKINNSQIGTWPPLDISFYTVVSGAMIGAEKQFKNNIKPDDIEVATYESDPTVARRVVFVDQFGNFYDNNNPLPATFTGTITIGIVEVKGTNGNFIEPNADGSINVIEQPIPSSSSQVVSTYNEILAVASGMTTQVVSYTVPVGKTVVLQRGAVSGENIARYDLLINGVIQDTVRTMFGGDLTANFDFTSGNNSGLLLTVGDVIKIQVLHNRPSTADFNGRIQVLVI